MCFIDCFLATHCNCRLYYLSLIMTLKQLLGSLAVDFDHAEGVDQAYLINKIVDSVDSVNKKQTDLVNKMIIAEIADKAVFGNSYRIKLLNFLCQSSLHRPNFSHFMVGRLPVVAATVEVYIDKLMSLVFNINLILHFFQLYLFILLLWLLSHQETQRQILYYQIL